MRIIDKKALSLSLACVFALALPGLVCGYTALPAKKAAYL
jgi:hypothetical protein